jgi:hypothetical protein
MTTMPISLPNTSSAERYRMLSMDTIRQRALERLYERKTVVENLIQSLEEYERAQGSRRAPCIDISVRRKYS